MVNGMANGEWLLWFIVWLMVNWHFSLTHNVQAFKHLGKIGESVEQSALGNPPQSESYRFL